MANTAISRVVPFVALLSSVVALAGCSDRAAGPRVPPDGPSMGAPSVPWSKKTLEERRAFMGAHVLPAMKRIFVESDASYAAFDCETCHGADMELIDYAMPNDLYALPADDPIGDAMDMDEDLATLMSTKVLPTMANLLSQRMGKGGEASCFTCHPKEE